MEVLRRDFLKAGGLVVTAMGLTMMGLNTKAHAVSYAKTILFDMGRCTGCRNCEVACRKWNRLPVEEDQATGLYRNRRNLTGTRWVSMWSNNKPGADVRYMRHSCMHCADAACVKVCPVGACTHTQFSTVNVNQDVCIGCNYCVSACPFRAMGFDQSAGVARKCTFCYDRLLRGDNPACVQACPTDALIFGRRDSLVLEAKDRTVQARKNNYPEADVYGIEELGGLGVACLLYEGKTSSLEKYGLPEDPQLPAHAQIWAPLFKPLKALAIAALTFGLVSNRLSVSHLQSPNLKNHSNQ
ncbi:MAG: 4Fe-4S dicluster domain-containing protein [Bacillota bacterium]